MEEYVTRYWHRCRDIVWQVAVMVAVVVAVVVMVVAAVALWEGGGWIRWRHSCCCWLKCPAHADL